MIQATKKIGTSIISGIVQKSIKVNNMLYFSSLLKTNLQYSKSAKNLFAALSKFGEEYDFFDSAKDIWARDYMPVKVRSGKYISFRYEPGYLKDYPQLKTDFKKDVAPQFNLPIIYSDINLDGGKDILGVWIVGHESNKFGLNALNDLKIWGILDVYMFCTDGLCGMMEAIQAVYHQSRLQRCIVHQIRSSTQYVSYKDIKKVVADLKKVYTAVTLDEAEENLRVFGNTWRKQYPSCVKSWEDNWEVLSTFFEYPPEIRKIIYTTNIIEGLNRQFRQITKNKPSFTNDDSLRRMLYLASQRIIKHWHARCQNWDMVLSQLQIVFADRKVG